MFVLNRKDRSQTGGIIVQAWKYLPVGGTKVVVLGHLFFYTVNISGHFCVTVEVKTGKWPFFRSTEQR